MLDQFPTEVTNHSKARTDGVSSSDMLGARLFSATLLAVEGENRSAS
jgi:hypothetical protein